MSTEMAVVNLLPKVQETWIAKVDLVTDSAAFSKNCQIKANNDLEAVSKWLAEYQHKKATYRNYRREAMRFVVWCMYERGVTLANLKKEDCETYFKFIQNPPENWCLQQGRVGTEEPGSYGWRTFKGKLGHTAVLMVVRVLNSMLNYLVQAEYIRANPIKLIKQYSKLSIDFNEHKYRVWERTLAVDEWEAILQALLEMPDKTRQQKETKHNTQFLFMLLYLLGLRINEAATHIWSNFRQKDGMWLFFVRGKGDKLEYITVNEQLLSVIQTHRKYLKKSQFPEPTEMESLIVSTKTKKPLKITQLYKLIKSIGAIAAQQFPDGSQQRQRLLKFSPHWLRHQLATDLGKAGVALNTIQAILRHSSIQTSTIYVHTENNERYNAMQKLQMQICPMVLSQEVKYIGYEFKIKLTRGPVSKLLGVERMIQTIEQQILKKLNFVRVGESTELLLEQIRQQGVNCAAVELVYQVRSQEVVDSVKIWENALKRQAEIWLFDCEIKTTGIKV